MNEPTRWGGAPWRRDEPPVREPGALNAKYTRLAQLMRVGNVDAPHIQTEIADIITDLKLNGETDADIAARTVPGVAGIV